MTIDVYIDNNVWDFLFERKLDLCIELPPNEFSFWIAREGEFEIEVEQMPAEKKAFARATISRCSVRTDVPFGFRDDNFSDADQRVGGFGVGRLLKCEESNEWKKWRVEVKKKKKKTGLFHNEADVTLIARSSSAVVLTKNNRKDQPFYKAWEQGKMIVFLKDFDESGMPLREFVLTKISQFSLTR